MKMPRIAIFSDAYHEANGVARTVHAIEACAKARHVPLLSVHAGPSTRQFVDGSVTSLDVKRSRFTSFNIEHDLQFDLSMWRHMASVTEALRAFAPDVVHFTGPSDVGQMGAYLGHRLSIPMVGSWHTNLHEYASRRLGLRWLPDSARAKAKTWTQDQALRALLLFYKIPRVLLAPNEETRTLLASETGKPTFMMTRGVNTDLFNPAKRRTANTIVNVGYVGRLSAEKNVRVLQQVEAALDAEGLDIRFTIVGDGSERDWLKKHMLRADFTGVLRGEELARAYAQMDVFVFPSETDTFGNVVLEAMASGVPVVAMARGGPKFLAETARSAILADDTQDVIDGVRLLVRDRARREKMGAAARIRALDASSWDSIFDSMCRAYQTAMSLADDQRRGRVGTAARSTAAC